MKKNKLLYKIIFAFILASPCNIASCQKETDTNHEFILKDSIPQHRLNYDKPGHYEIVVTADKTELDPGESFIVKIFFTGYGQIGLSKVAFYSSKEDIFSDSSAILTDLKKNGNEIRWGNHTYKLSSNYVVNILGLEFENKQKIQKSSYFDIGRKDDELAIMSESSSGGAPFVISFFLKKNIEPGKYKLNFYYTYFNGREWASSTNVIEFKVKDFVERNELFLTIITLVIGVISLFPLFIDGIKFIFKIIGRRKNDIDENLFGNHDSSDMITQPANNNLQKKSKLLKRFKK